MIRKYRNRKRAALSLLLFALAIIPFTAQAVSLPEALTFIGEEAFRGNLSLTSVQIPENVTEIGEYAFADCVNLAQVTVPAQVESIGAGAFDGCGEALLIITEPDCEGVYFARGNRIDYQADTHYRALVIAQSYPGTSMRLDAPPNDQAAVHACLNHFATTNWTVTNASNLRASQITPAILSVFSAATENDVSLLYYSGHGEEDGSLLGKDLKTLKPAALKDCLDQIPGRKIIIVDACYSGQLIREEEEETEEGQGGEDEGGTDPEEGGESQGGTSEENGAETGEPGNEGSDENETGESGQSGANGFGEQGSDDGEADESGQSSSGESGTGESGGEDSETELEIASSAASVDGAAQFVSAFQAAFSGGGRLLRGALNDSNYFVLTAARWDEDCEEGFISSGGASRDMGFFSYAFCLGCGYNGVTQSATGSLPADSNEDGAVSLREAYYYASSLALSYNDRQHAMLWPSGCAWFAPFRP